MGLISILRLLFFLKPILNFKKLKSKITNKYYEYYTPNIWKYKKMLSELQNLFNIIIIISNIIIII